MTRIIGEQHLGHACPSIAACLAAVTLAVAGCSGGGDAPQTIPVEGKVTLAGQPLTQGSVTFQPVTPAAGFPNRPATGNIQSDGTYKMGTFVEGDGVIPGEYKVLVNTMTGGPTLEDPNIPAVWAAPEKYAHAAQSPLTASVPPDHSGTLVVDLALEK